MNDIHRRTRDLLAHYLDHFSDESSRFTLLQRQLEGDPSLFKRSNMTGHVTSSAAVLTPDATEILLIHHAFLKKWLTPGGHYEGPGDLFESALREVKEETGVTDASAHPWTLSNNIPLDIDSHDVPARPEKGEVAHIHHDFLFLAMAPADAYLQAQLSEVHDAIWASVAELEKSSDKRVLLLHQKLLSIGAISQNP